MNVIKIVMLFVGTIIGAGFATGKEVMLYFSNANMVTLIASAIVMGGLCWIFLSYGKVLAVNKYVSLNIAVKTFDNIMGIIIWICSALSFCCMVSASQTLIKSCFNLSHAGIICGVAVAFLSLFEMDFIKKINLVLIPLLIILVAVMFVMSDQKITGKTHLVSSLSYCGMNLLLGGAIITQQGKKLTNKQAIMASVCVAIVFGILLIMINGVCLNYPMAEMPMLSFAMSKGCGGVAGVIIMVAVFTTMLSCGKLSGDYLVKKGVSKIATVIFIIGLVLMSSDWNFGKAVNLIYPIQGIIGIVYCVLTFIILVSKVVIFRKHKKIDIVFSRN